MHVPTNLRENPADQRALLFIQKERQKKKKKNNVLNR
jgi:hypothetical protein